MDFGDKLEGEKNLTENFCKAKFVTFRVYFCILDSNFTHFFIVFLQKLRFHEKNRFHGKIQFHYSKVEIILSLPGKKNHSFPAGKE